MYALLDSGSEESLISKRLYNELNLKGVPLEVLLITANGSRNLVSTFDTNFKIGPAHNSVEKFNISQALVMDELLSIEKIFSTRNNLRFYIEVDNSVMCDKSDSCGDACIEKEVVEITNLSLQQNITPKGNVDVNHSKIKQNC